MDGPDGSRPRPPVRVAPRLTIAEFFRQCLGEFRKIVWPSGRTVRTNAIVMLLTVVTLMAALGTLELAVGRLAGDLFS
jgi:preprotein translocase SecE subunit